MFRSLFATAVAAAMIAMTVAECPNACSAHGRCGAFDMCVCYKNWMANDCSERICQFALAHVDTPKGDLDASSGALTGPATTVIVNNDIYPYGTQELYPQFTDSGDNVLDNTGHAYAECANKGICDRQTGTCSCVSGYGGSACQRALCPASSNGVCSGHGTCNTISRLAKLDFNNVYELWDKDSTMGCYCDAGYTGPDCSQRVCKYGADPLYHDDFTNPRFANFTYQIYTKASVPIYGNYSLVFTDKYGEPWQTSAISITATCTEVVAALEALPNDVIPSNSVRCVQPTSITSSNIPIYDANLYIGGSNTVVPKFTLAFPKNLGYIKQIALNKYLDGKRPTLYTSESTSTLNWHIYVNGFTGEDTDYVPDLCRGVSVTIQTASSSGNYTQTLGGLTTAEAKLLKACLGDSNGNSADNVEVYNWDYGNVSPRVPWSIGGIGNTLSYKNYYANPHLIKLIDATADDVTGVLANTVNTEDLQDPAQFPYPKTTLCDSTSVYINADYPTGWCANRNPPGFYAVIYFDGTNFNIINRPGADYDTTTTFHVYTTTGYLQRVSPIVAAASYYATDSTTQILDQYHSNEVYLYNTTAPSTTFTTTPYYGAIDCETNPSLSNSVADCVNKDDLVLFLNVDLSSAGQAVNPIYVNLHKVKKIYRADRADVSNYNSERQRNKLVLDYGVNTKFNSNVPAAIYKFHPPTGYNYVAQCSNRGLCDTTSGLCNCFAGYTNDNCDTQNALAV